MKVETDGLSAEKWPEREKRKGSTGSIARVREKGGRRNDSVQILGSEREKKVVPNKSKRERERRERGLPGSIISEREKR